MEIRVKKRSGTRTMRNEWRIPLPPIRPIDRRSNLFRGRVTDCPGDSDRNNPTRRRALCTRSMPSIRCGSTMERPLIDPVPFIRYDAHSASVSSAKMLGQYIEPHPHLQSHRHLSVQCHCPRSMSSVRDHRDRINNDAPSQSMIRRKLMFHQRR